jgi:hypothetical protein
MTENAVFTGKSAGSERLNLGYANRAQFIAGSTGTGKIVNLQILAEGLSAVVFRSEFLRGIFRTQKRR